MKLDPVDAIQDQLVRLMSDMGCIAIYTPEEWESLDITEAERASGWCDALPRGTYPPDIVEAELAVPGLAGHSPFAFRFCCEVIAARTDGMRDLDAPTTWGDPIDPETRDGVVRTIAHALHHQVLSHDMGADAANAVAFSLLTIEAELRLPVSMALR